MKTGKIIIAVFILLLAFTTNAQVQKPKYSTVTTAFIKCSSTFPECFTGDWKGTLQWMVAGRPPQIFTMQLRIRPTDSAGQYSWQIIYGDSGKDTRPYILKPIDTAKGHWAIDEKDGIVLDSYVHGNCIHGAFTVQGNTIIDNYCIEEGKIKVEFFSIKLNDKIQSGKGTATTPFVDSYLISSYQTGVLIRVDNL